MLTFFCFVFQLIYRPDNGEILGVHIFGLHAADLIHEASNAIALGTRIQVRTCLSLTIIIRSPQLQSLNSHELLLYYLCPPPYNHAHNNNFHVCETMRGTMF